MPFISHQIQYHSFGRAETRAEMSKEEREQGNISNGQRDVGYLFFIVWN